jgi:hypothetical protein
MIRFTFKKLLFLEELVRGSYSIVFSVNTLSVREVSCKQLSILNTVCLHWDKTNDLFFWHYLPSSSTAQQGYLYNLLLVWGKKSLKWQDLEKVNLMENYSIIMKSNR